MAHLTGSQKKNRNKFIALLVAILVVAAAIFFVVYSSVMEKSAFLGNQDFATALSQVYDKAARKVSQNDLASAKLLVVNNTGNSAEEFVVLTGDEKAVAEYAKWNEQSMASIDDPEVQITADVAAYAASAVFETENFSADDLKYFTGAEAVDISGIVITDPALISNFKNLKYGAFTSCGLTELSGFSALDLSKIESLNLSGNNIEDWSVLEPIAEKVIVSIGYTLVPDGESYTIAQVATTLAEQMASEAEAEAETAEEAEAAEEAEVAEGEATEEVAEETTEDATEEVVEEATEENAEETTETVEEAVDEAVETTEVTE